MRPDEVGKVLSTVGGAVINLELPSESSFVSFVYFTGNVGASAVYLDQRGVEIGRSQLVYDNKGLKRLSFEAPEGVLVASIQLTAPNPGSGSSGLRVDLLEWGERYPTEISISKAESDGFGGRIVFGSVENMLYLLPDMVIQVSTDDGDTWTDAVFSEGSWAVVQSGMPAGDWTAQVRMVERSTGRSIGLSDSKFVDMRTPGIPAIERIADAEGMYTQAKAADGSLIEISLEGTGAKQGDTVHIRWGSVTYDQALTKSDVDSGRVAVKMPADRSILQGVDMDFSVTAQIVGKNGIAGAVSQPYQVVGTYFVGQVITDTLLKPLVGNTYVYNNGFTIETDGVMVRAAATSSTYAGLTINGAEGADASFVFALPLREFGLRLSGIDSELGVKILILDTKGGLIEEQTVFGDSTAFHANTFSYVAQNELVDIGAIKIIGNEASLTLDAFKMKQVVHTVDTREPNVIGSVSESFFGTDADDVVVLQTPGWAFLTGASAGINGGAGIDTLKFTSTAGAQLPSVRNVSSMEIFDLGSTTSSNSRLLYLSLSDVLRNGGVDAFYEGGASRVQMIVKATGGNAGLILNDTLVGGFNVGPASTYSSGGDLGDWVAKGAVTVNGQTYTSYQHSTIAAEVLVQGVHVTIQNRSEIVAPAARGLRSFTASDMVVEDSDSVSPKDPQYVGIDVPEASSVSLLQSVEVDLFASQQGLFEITRSYAEDSGGGTLVTSLNADIFDQNQVSYVLM